MHTPLHSSCGAGGGDTGTWQDAKQSSYLQTSQPRHWQPGPGPGPDKRRFITL